MNELQLQIEALKKKIVPRYVKSIDIDEGWYQIVVDCDKELTEIDPYYQIFQIKEKFGGLRYYMSPSGDITPEQIDAMWAITGKYEALSVTICEATGKPGVLMRSPTGWFKTLNPDWAFKNSPYDRYVIVT
jgi:hypothetical protein